MTKRGDLIHALMRVLIRGLISRRAAIHDRCDALNWCWEDTQDESHQLEQVDHALTEVGFFNTDGETIS